MPQHPLGFPLGSTPSIWLHFGPSSVCGLQSTSGTSPPDEQSASVVQSIVPQCGSVMPSASLSTPSHASWVGSQGKRMDSVAGSHGWSTGRQSPGVVDCSEGESPHPTRFRVTNPRVVIRRTVFFQVHMSNRISRSGSWLQAGPRSWRVRDRIFLGDFFDGSPGRS